MTRKTEKICEWDIGAIETLIHKELETPRTNLPRWGLNELRVKLLRCDGTGRLNLTTALFPEED